MTTGAIGRAHRTVDTNGLLIPREYEYVPAWFRATAEILVSVPEAVRGLEMPTDELSPNAVLIGGLGRIPHAQRIRWVEDTRRELKIFQGNRHEHFRPTAEVFRIGDWELHVYRWTTCTYVAE